ncbi:adrenodoxin-like protein 2, mitochondrial Ferredoxin 2 isoform X2 [Augochlora pura]
MALVNKFQQMSRTFFGVVSNYSKYKNNKALSSFQTIRQTSTTQPLCEKQEVNITFIKANGEKIKAKGKEGDTILDIVVNNEIDLDGYGACEGTLTCSTCHLIFPKEVYDTLPDKPTDEELDMLDLAYELTDTFLCMP